MGAVLYLSRPGWRITPFYWRLTRLPGAAAAAAGAERRALLRETGIFLRANFFRNTVADAHGMEPFAIPHECRPLCLH
jgi:hypothetical protein